MSSNGLGTSIAHISLRGVRRTTSPRQVSDPLGKYNFSFTPLRMVVAVLVQYTRAMLPSE